jgi:hypothetical protein
MGHCPFVGPKTQGFLPFLFFAFFFSRPQAARIFWCSKQTWRFQLLFFSTPHSERARLQHFLKRFRVSQGPPRAFASGNKTGAFGASSTHNTTATGLT